MSTPDKNHLKVCTCKDGYGGACPKHPASPAAGGEDVVAIVKELQEKGLPCPRCGRMGAKAKRDGKPVIWCPVCVDSFAYSPKHDLEEVFPAVAAHLLDLDARLRVAVEALEWYEGQNLEGCWEVAATALERIRPSRPS